MNYENLDLVKETRDIHIMFDSDEKDSFLYLSGTVKGDYINWKCHADW